MAIFHIYVEPEVEYTGKSCRSQVEGRGKSKQKVGVSQVSQAGWVTQH